MLYVMGIVLESAALLSGCVLTSDCISSERRNGTLDLHFLTRLRAHEIVLGKMASSSLQAGLCFLAAFPMFFLPVFVGGVDWSQILLGLTVVMFSFLLSISIGAWFSTRSDDASKNALRTFITIFILTAGPILLLILGKITRTAVPFFAEIAIWSPGYLWHIATVTTNGTGLLRSGFFIPLQILPLISVLAVIATADSLRRFRKRDAGPAHGRKASQSADLVPGRRSTRPIYTARPIPKAVFVIITLLACLWAAMLAAVPLVPDSDDQELFVAASFTLLAIHIFTKFVAYATLARPMVEDRNSGALELLLTTPMRPIDYLRAYRESHGGLFKRTSEFLITLTVFTFLWAVMFHEDLHINPDEMWIFASIFLGGVFASLADFRTILWINAYYGVRGSVFWKAATRSALAVTVFPWLYFFVILAFLEASNAGVNEGVLVLYFLSCHAFSLVIAHFQRKHSARMLTRYFRELAAGEPVPSR